MLSPTLLFIVSSGLAAAVPLDQVRPGKLRKSAVVHASSAQGRTAVVDGEHTLWVGQTKLQEAGRLREAPTRMSWHGDHLVLVYEHRQGLWARTNVEIRDRSGKALRESLQDAPLLASAVGGDTLALGFPGELLLLPLGPGEQRSIPLPFSLVVDVAADGAEVRVQGPGDLQLTVELETGCPGPVLAGRGPLALVRADRTQRVCEQGLAPLSGETRALAAVQRTAEIRRAAVRGDMAALSALGVRGKPMLEGVRPEAGPAVGRYSTREDRSLDIHPSLLGGAGTVVISDPDPELDLRPWVSGPLAPACSARIVLAAPHVEIIRDLHAQVLALRAEGVACADDLVVTNKGMVGDARWPVVYVNPDRTVAASRDAQVTPVHARLDIARAFVPDVGTDPLSALANVSDLFANWHEGPGPVTEIVLDKDGSWVAGVGWDLVRATAGNLRTVRAKLMGPVVGIRIREDGRVDAVSGGQRVEVDLERRKEQWGPSRDAQAAPQAIEQGMWSVRDGATVLNGDTGVRLVMPVPVLSVGALGDGVVIRTDLGLFGADAQGVIQWRVIGATHWVAVDGVLVVGGADGVSGYYLPG